jgi:hypothetical protein
MRPYRRDVEIIFTWLGNIYEDGEAHNDPEYVSVKLSILRKLGGISWLLWGEITH